MSGAARDGAWQAALAVAGASANIRWRLSQLGVADDMIAGSVQSVERNVARSFDALRRVAATDGVAVVEAYAEELRCLRERHARGTKENEMLADQVAALVEAAQRLRHSRREGGSARAEENYRAAGANLREALGITSNVAEEIVGAALAFISEHRASGAAKP